MFTEETLPARLLTVREAVRVLGISRSTVYALMKGGKLASVKIGRARRFPVEAIDEYLAGLPIQLGVSAPEEGAVPSPRPSKRNFGQTASGGAGTVGPTPPRASRATSAGRPGTAAAA